MTQKLDQVTEKSITQLVHQFYGKVRQDDNLNPIFERAMGGGENKHWQHHLNTMVDFWSSIMLTSGRYNGTPMRKHKELPSFDLNLFEKWLKLFEETAREIHTEEIVEKYKAKSSNIARSLKLGINPNAEGGDRTIL